MEEIWKDINGYVGLYRVSNLGRVFSIRKNIILRPWVARGYERMCLVTIGKNKRTYSVHTLVLDTFSPITINHKDGNKANNKLENLERLTVSENIHHAMKIGLRNDKGESHNMAKLNEQQVKAIRELCDLGIHTYTKIGKMFGVSGVNVSEIHKRMIWKHI